MRLCGHTTDVRVDFQTFSVFRVPQSWDLPVEHFRDNIQVKYREIKSTPDNYVYMWVHQIIIIILFVTVTVLQGHMIIVFGAANVIASEFFVFNNRTH